MTVLIRKIGRYLRTVRYLKPIQIYWRIWIAIRSSWAPPLRNDVSLRRGFSLQNSLPDFSFNDGYLTFLNVTANVRGGMPWQDHSLSRLWLYNLHYFHYLSCGEVNGGEIIRDWIEKNPAAKGVGWESYPTALRIVSWIKHYTRLLEDGRKNETPDNFIQSLYQQAFYMERNLEYHLLGNHLFKNIKALLFAGCFFDGQDASRWLHKGLLLLEREVKEQILDDGGHFERSPMYHSLILEDLLDVYNALRNLSPEMSSLLQLMKKRIIAMICWQETMTHPDGRLSLFNDSALMEQGRIKRLKEYAADLKVLVPDPINVQGLVGLESSGYYVFKSSRYACFMDVGEIGPTYIPGHAHCDLLSYELSVGIRRVVIDTGTYAYEADGFRHYTRSTAAHNTVMIDDEEQSEIWKCFRVGRRATPHGVAIATGRNCFMLAATHDGYRHLSDHPVHRRTFHGAEDYLTVVDFFEGDNCKIHRFKSFLHLHPGLKVSESALCMTILAEDDAPVVKIEFNTLFSVAVAQGYYCPEFGQKHEGKVLVITGEATLPVTFSYTIRML